MKERVVAIMQARSGSSRLPGKSLQELHPGLTLLGAIAERVRRTPNIAHFVVATTTDSLDDELASQVTRLGWQCVRGHATDVLQRYHQAAEECDAGVIVRVTADDPFKDPAVIAKAISLLGENPELDYVSNTMKPTYPEGLDIEVVRRRALDRAFEEATLPSDREHVMPFIWRQPEKFRTLNFEHDVDLSALRWTVDYPEDMTFARAVYAALYPKKPAFDMADILALLDRDPSVRQMMTSFQRNAGYLASLAQEKK
jgi:spore coat polysaccharide biosynthesis protein SpsF